MTSAKTTCTGCGREFAPRGFTNHLRLPHDPRCGSLRDELVYRYTATPANRPTGFPHTPRSTTPDVQMFDVSNEGSPPRSEIFPSSFHEDVYMSIDDDDDGEGSDGDEDNGNNNDGDYTSDGGGGENGVGLEDSEGDIDHSLETVFHRPSRPTTATIDSDTEPEISDDEEEPQRQPASLPLNPENSRSPGCSSVPGGYFRSVVNSFLTTPTTLGAQNNEDHIADPQIFVKFGGRAGEVLPAHPKHVGYAGYSCALGVEDVTANEWAPFSTRTEWELARWAKLRGPSSTALSELLKIDGVSRSSSPDLICFNFLSKVVENLGLSFSSTDELNRIIDTKLPNGLPQFVREEVTIAGQKYEFYHRDIIQCIRILYGNPELAPFLAHVPEKHYTSPDKKTRIYSEMHTGKWWWKVQVGSISFVTMRISDVD